MSNFPRIVKTQVKFWKLHVLDVILWHLRFIFSGSHRKFSLVLLQLTNYIFSPWRCKKECNIRLFWYNVFVHWKLKITQFPGGFRLKLCFLLKKKYWPFLVVLLGVTYGTIVGSLFRGGSRIFLKGGGCTTKVWRLNWLVIWLAKLPFLRRFA